MPWLLVLRHHSFSAPRVGLQEEKMLLKSSVLVALLLSVLAAFASAFPSLREFGEQESHEVVTEEEPDNTGVRFRRVTCDILSVSLPFVTVNHAACAAHCLGKRKGYRGGRCKDGVCHCRK